jgi:hypothetical protein
MCQRSAATAQADEIRRRESEVGEKSGPKDQRKESHDISVGNHALATCRDTEAGLYQTP